MSEGTHWLDDRICGTCGRAFPVLHPNVWSYKRGYKFHYTYFCSYSCMRKYDKEQEGKEEFDMAGRTKKDGTPAKKPGPKSKKIEVPETVDGGPWEKMETPQQVATVKLTGPIKIEAAEPEDVELLTHDEQDEARDEKEKDFGLPAYIDGFEINGLRGQFGDYKANEEVNYFEFVPFGGELCMSPKDWRDQMDELMRAAKVLGVKL